MNKQEFWPKEGKLKKGIILLVIVMVSALLIVLIEEKTGNKVSKKLSAVIAFTCVAIWFYQPTKKENL